jgi:hypothetical protein
MPLIVIAGKPRGDNPGSVVGHRTFDGEHAAIVIGDDEEKRGGWLGGHGEF